MKRNFLVLALALLTLCAVGCQPQGEQNSFTLKAIVKSTEDLGRIEVDVIESDYASGIYWVLIGNGTKITDSHGKAICVTDIKVGDTVEITYSGQVMMSYPPQIAAIKIKKL